MLSVLFGLLSAAGWGASDFVGGLSARRAGAFQSVLFVEMISLVLLPLAALWFNEPIIRWQEWLWCAAAGGFGVVALALLFQAFVDGQMSIATSVSAVTAAVLPIVVSLFTEGVPQPGQLAGFCLALVAIWFITWGGKGSEKLHLHLKTIRMQLLAGIGFGLYFILIHHGSQHSVIWPMIASRSAGIFILAAILLGQRKNLYPGRDTWLLLFLNFILDIAANITYIRAGQLGRMDVAAVLTSMYPGFTILLARLFLGEHTRRLQTAGILLAAGAILLIAL
jgi:drug/metabolite transporter (DMT)-like permease